MSLVLKKEEEEEKDCKKYALHRYIQNLYVNAYTHTHTHTAGAIYVINYINHYI